MALAEAIAELEGVLGARLSTARAERDQHGRSETWFPDAPPDAVAFPESAQEVSEIVKICARHDVPVTAWGTGTSLEGHALPIRGGISLDLTRMDRVLEILAEDMQVRVQPGITREALNTDLRATGLFFPVDPGANASIGGMAATRASGTTTVRYGSMRDNVMALEVVMADGRIIRTGSRAKKTAAGYDLTALMLGSEGTLGVITELTLKLHGQPEAISSAVCAFDTLEAAVETVQLTIQMGIPMARIEFVDDLTAQIFNEANGTNFPAKPHLLIEFHGSEQAVAEASERFGEVVADMGGADFQWATTTEERNRLWRMRHGAYPATIAHRPGCMGLVTDICVPISRLAEAVSATKRDIEAAGLIGPVVGHVGDGNFHSVLLLDPEDADEFKRAKEVAGKMAERALAMGGTVTGEHGIGMGKIGYMRAEHGAGWDAMAQIKRALDPQNILNPGKVVEQN
ncbi:FAD-binding oxidoreductase [Thioclava atlantica]|uniref:D-lactate dehydrogenase (cytochrome) n=1 Tax=Thioclava atlantica TaxID=1317124 RepID=A0A085TSS7_9RHOB|nr:FAD-linked oxidase C-terminal domain-containing protein [Thioclava atlantica]KFE33774.1 D-lactate dehydrogenase [Thioclava atlantica]